jgi:hypothetical protein
VVTRVHKRRVTRKDRPFAVGGERDAAALFSQNSNAAVMRAEALSRKEGHVGAVAFSRTGDPATGDFSDAKVIKKFGC